MPVSPTYPGVYIEEIPSGVRTITGVATSITAFLGRAARGPVNEPVTIFNFGDFEKKFGGLNVHHPLGYSVRDFFANGGSTAIIVRLYKAGATDGCARLNHDGVHYIAASPGSWGNNLSLSVNTDGIGPSGVNTDINKRYNLDPATILFNLIITDAGTGNTEIISNVSCDDCTRRVDKVLKQSSSLILVDNTTTVSHIDPITALPLTSFADGVDSASLTVSGDFTGNRSSKTGLYALEKADLFNLLCIPPDTRNGDILADVNTAAVNYCVERRAMLIVDPSSTLTAASSITNATFTGLGITGEAARNAAFFFPRVIESDPMSNNQFDTFVPCGIAAGIMSRTDSRRGVWKAPAGTDATLSGVQGLSVSLTDSENGTLNPLGVNCLRTFPVSGNVIWGARTMRGADQLSDDYKYIPVRRLALFIEETLYRATQWVVFEPNDEPLWSQIRLNVGAFMHDLFTKGAFQGSTPKDAYLVKCDKETTTQNDINLGIVNILVMFAPLKPAEFVIIKIQQMAGQIQS